MSNKIQDDLDDDLQEWPFPGISPEAYRAGIEQIVRDMINGKNTKHW